MRAYVFYSVHERLFRRMTRELVRRQQIEGVSGFVWGEDQRRYLRQRSPELAHLTVFTRDVLPRARTHGRQVELLQAVEERSGFSIHRLIWSERHLLAGRSYEEVLSLAATLYETISETFDETNPDFIFSEDVSCLASYLHWVVAAEKGIPFFCIGDARIRHRVSVYRDLQEWKHTRAAFERLHAGGLTREQRRAASGYVERFRARPERPAGMDVRARLPIVDRRDISRLLRLGQRYWVDRENPVLEPPHTSLLRRMSRLRRSVWTQRAGFYDEPSADERYVLYPIHFQPEASTLVLAPMFLDQVALIENIAKSLPVGHYLYVKEHMSNRGRRPLSFYRRIARIPAVRLIGPDADTWKLIQGAAAVAVITGTMGWEGLIFQKPVVTFGQVFFNGTKQVYEARLVPLDAWAHLFARAIAYHEHDEEALLSYVAAMHETSSPGFMRNADSFPEVLDEENVGRLCDALMSEVGRDRPEWRFD